MYEYVYRRNIYVYINMTTGERKVERRKNYGFRKKENMK
jgi:hypothetical protein